MPAMAIRGSDFRQRQRLAGTLFLNTAFGQSRGGNRLREEGWFEAAPTSTGTALLRQRSRKCLKTRDTPTIVARLSVYAWKGTLTPTLSQREREPEESPLPRFGGEVRVRGCATVITDCRLLRHFLNALPTNCKPRLQTCPALRQPLNPSFPKMSYPPRT